MNTEKSKHKMSSVKDFKYLSIIMCAFIFQAGCDSKPKPPNISAEDKALSELKKMVEWYENGDSYNFEGSARDTNYIRVGGKLDTKVVDWNMETHIDALTNTNSVRMPFKAYIHTEAKSDRKGQYSEPHRTTALYRYKYKAFPPSPYPGSSDVGWDLEAVEYPPWKGGW